MEKVITSETIVFAKQQIDGGGGDLINIHNSTEGTFMPTKEHSIYIKLLSFASTSISSPFLPFLRECLRRPLALQPPRTRIVVRRKLNLKLLSSPLFLLLVLFLSMKRYARPPGSIGSEVNRDSIAITVSIGVHRKTAEYKW